MILGPENLSSKKVRKIEILRSNYENFLQPISDSDIKSST